MKIRTNDLRGASNQLRVRLDEEEYEMLRDRIFPSPPGIAPPFPRHIFLGREEALHDVKGRVTQTDSRRSNVIIVRGWPGVGKSALVGVLARDVDVVEAFSDGVLWASLDLKANRGKSDLLSKMATWGRALGTEELLGAETLAEASHQLEHFLHDKRMLLILDDVWESSDAIPFLKAAGHKCVTLITTRETTGVALDLAPFPEAVYVLPVLTEEDGFQLLSILSPDAVREHPGECRELVRALECLPLLLQVAGRLMHSGQDIKSLLKDIQGGANILAGKGPGIRDEARARPTVKALLKTTTDHLDDLTRSCFAYLAPFAPKPATFDMSALKDIWQVEDPRPIVRKLVGHGLIEPAGSGRYQAHPLLIQHARSLLG